MERGGEKKKKRKEEEKFSRWRRKNDWGSKIRLTINTYLFLSTNYFQNRKFSDWKQNKLTKQPTKKKSKGKRRRKKKQKTKTKKKHTTNKNTKKKLFLLILSSWSCWLSTTLPSLSLLSCKKERSGGRQTHWRHHPKKSKKTH